MQSFMFKKDGVEAFLKVSDEATLGLLKLNVGSVEPGAVALWKRNTPDQPVTADDVPSLLKTGTEMRQGYQPDGERCNCGICGVAFQPLVIPYLDREKVQHEGGNFLVVKAAILAELTKASEGRPALSADKAEKIMATAKATTASLMGTEPIPDSALALAVCKFCREARQKAGFRDRYFSRASARESLPDISGRIEVASNRREISNALGGYRRPNTFKSAGPSNHGRRDDGQRREQKPRFDWHGAKLEQGTITALTAANVTTIADALALTKDQMFAAGVAHAGSIDAIQRELRRAANGGAVVAGARGASELSARRVPGAVPDGKKASAKKPKPVRVDVPRGSGGAVKLASLEV